MVIFRAINASWPRRIQFAAFAVLATASILAGVPKGVRAEWFAFKKIPVPVETLEPKPNEGFDKAIRNLLKEAQRHEKKGELDQAINLAERAAKISDESSSLVRVAPDISSSAISDYAKELRIKKQQVELSLKRAKTPTSNTVSVASGRLKKESPTAKDNAPRSSRVKPPVETEPVASHVRGKDNSETDLESKFSGKANQSQQNSRRNDSTSVAVNIATSDMPESESVDLPSPSERTVERVTTMKKAVAVKTIVTSTEELPFEPFAEEEPRQTHVPLDIRSFPESNVVSTEAIQTANVDVTAEPRNVTLIASSSIESEHPTTRTDTQTVKLRNRYQDTDPSATASIKSTSDVRILETKGKVTTASIEIDDPSNDRDEQPLADRQVNEFPVIQVRDLRQAADRSSELDPGDTLPTSTIPKEEFPEMERENQPTPSKSLSPFRIRGSLKLRNTYSVLPMLTPIAARSTREPVVGRTSIIHWRPVRDALSVTTDDAIPENDFKTDASATGIRQMQSDNDRSVIDHVSTGIRHSSAHDSEIQAALELTTASSVKGTLRRSDENNSIARREFRGSLWDNAAAPTFEGTWRPAKPHPENQGSAPLPPKSNRIEQTAFVQPHHEVKKDLRSQLNRDSTEVIEQASTAPLESSSMHADLAETAKQPQVVESESINDNVELDDTIVTNNSTPQSVHKTGLSESTASTILGAFGIGLLIAGLWMFRVTVGSKHV